MMTSETQLPKQHWLVTGASGLLGHVLCQHLLAAGLTVTGVRHTHPVGIAGVNEISLDLTAEVDIAGVLAANKIDVVVHAAGLTNVDECERNPALARDIHVELTRRLAEAAKLVSAKVVYISTDHLWDGLQPLVDETTPTYPINVYAQTKLDGELVAVGSSAKNLSVRTNFFGHGRQWRQSLSDWILGRLNAGGALKMFGDAYFTPISLDHLCAVITQLVDKEASGIYHVAGAERLTKYEFALKLAEAADLPTGRIQKISTATAGLAAPRPLDMSLCTNKVSGFLGTSMPDVSESLATLFPPNGQESSELKSL